MSWRSGRVQGGVGTPWPSYGPACLVSMPMRRPAAGQGPPTQLPRLRAADGLLARLSALGASWPHPADLGLGAVDAQLDPVGGGVGEHIGQGAQSHPGQAGHREAARGQQRPDLADRARDGGGSKPYSTAKA